MSEFYIDTNSGPLPQKILDQKITQYQIPSMRVKLAEEKVLDSSQPRRIIAQNKLVVERMVEQITQIGNTETDTAAVEETFNLLEDLPCNLDNKVAFGNEVKQISGP